MNPIESILRGPKAAVEVSANLSRSVHDRVNGFFDDVLELVAPSFTSAEFVERLQRKAPQQDLEIGINAVRVSDRALKDAIALHGLAGYMKCSETTKRAERKLEDSRIMRSIGYAIMKHAVVKADDSEAVPAHVSRDVVYDAIDHGAVPDKKGFVTEKVQKSFAHLYEKHDNIISLHRAG